VRTVALGEIVSDARTGFASGEDTEDGIVQVRMNNVTTEGTFDWSKLRRVPEPKRLDDLIVKSNDILLNATNSPDLVGKNAVFKGFPEPVTFSNHFIRIRLDERVADSGLVSRWLTDQWRRGKFKSMCRQWVNQASLNKEQLLSLDVPLPPLDEQRRIAALLDQADDLRRKRREALGKLKIVPRLVFLEMFGDPVANKRGWKTIHLGDAGKLDRGVSKHRPRNDPVLLGGAYPLIQTGDITNCDGYIRTFTSTCSEEGLKQSRLWPTGTLCITIAANIGNTGILTFDACYPDSIVGFVPNADVRTEYIQQWFVFVQPTLEKDAPQFAQKNINLAILRGLELPLPPLDLQRTFASRVAAIDKLKSHLRAHLAKLDALFASLQHRAFTGEL
jgi:type I restriction enzyme, S subunit